MWQTLNQLDIEAFLWLNNLGSPIYDPLWMWITDWGFIPLVVVMVFFLVNTYQWRKTIIAAAVVGLVILIVDQLCGNIIREMNIRLRPCHMEELAGKFRAVRYDMTGYCGGMYGFVSSHSGNAFALAVFSIVALKGKVKQIGWWMFVWAFIIAYSRVYIGTHFTGDVIVGGMIGCFFGWLGGYVFLKLISKKIKFCKR